MENGLTHVFKTLDEKIGKLDFDLWFANEKLKDSTKEIEALKVENKALLEQIAVLTKQLVEKNNCTPGHCEAVNTDE